MADINSYYEFEKENNAYKAEIVLCGFKIFCKLEPLFDDKEKRLRYIVNFSKNILFEKLGSKFERNLKSALTGGMCHCYNEYNGEREKQQSLEKLTDNLKIKFSGRKDDWDCITGDMILKVPKKVKEAIEKISKEQSGYGF